MKDTKTQKTNVMRVLDQKKVSYDYYTYPHNNEAVDGLEVSKLIGVEKEKVYKTLVTRSSINKNNYYVFVIPVASQLDLKKAAKSVKEKAVEMVHVKDLLQITGYVRGGCSPIGMKKFFPTTFNNTINNITEIVFSAGKIGFQVKIQVKDISKIIKYNIDDIIE